jgi:hypothetical protein
MRGYGSSLNNNPMDVTALDTQTDFYAKSNSTMFPLAEKLAYYIEADGILNALIIDEQEDTNEEEDTKTTVADQRDYKQKARIHHINWLKINYGDGFIPARYKSEQDLISEYGNDLETTLSQWDQSDPIYWYKGSSFFIVPAPSSAQAGADRLKVSQELLPSDLDRTSNTTPQLVPSNFHYLHAACAAMSWLDTDDPLWAKNEKRWNEGVKAMLTTMFPRNRQAYMQAHIPEDDGSTY